MIHAPTTISVEMDLAHALLEVLHASPEPLTLPRIRGALPVEFRDVPDACLSEVLHRQAAAEVIWQYPKYRSQHERFWDRPMPVHVVALVRDALATGPLARAELRRKLPGYALPLLETTLDALLARRELHLHPRTGRGGERLGLVPPDPRAYLRPELDALFVRLETLGFPREQVRLAALELLHHEEWDALPLPPGAEETALCRLE